jgi:hypothetical protein
MAFNWSGGDLVAGSSLWCDSVWADSLGLFVALHRGSGTDHIQTSPDGVTWTSRTTPNQSSAGLSWSEDDGTLIVAGTNSIYSSTDGVTWSAGTAPDTNAWFRGAYAPSLALWAFVGGGGTQRVATSATGIDSWTLRTTPNAAYYDIAWSPSLSLFAALGFSNVMTSPDGVTWTARTITISGGSYLYLFWSTSLSKFVVFGKDATEQSIFTTSSDGITWAAETVIDTQEYGGWALDDSTPRFVGVLSGASPVTAITTSDLVTWTEQSVTSPYGTDDVIIATGPYGSYSPSLGMFVFVGNGDNLYDFLSAEGISGTDDTFWYKSDVPGLESGVDATAVSGASARPKGPRGNVFTTPFSESNPLYGFPGHAVAVTNRLIYAGGDYTVGTDLPPIRVWNGTSDYQLAVVPRDGSGNIPKCVVSIVNGDGKVYLATWDTGTTSSNIAGRVLRLDPNSGQLTNVGNVNTLTGYLPWALKFHNGELWVGAHRSNTSAGRIYRIKPEEQTTWTLDRDLTTDSVGACTLIDSYKGKMYFGSSAASGTFAKWGSRDTTGTYALLYTGTGGTAQDYNGFYASCVFGDNIYFSYWNPDTTEISLIKKYDGSSVTTAKDVAAVASVPIIALFVNDGVLYALGMRRESDAYTSLVLTTTDGTTWTNRTGDLPLGDFTSRGVTNAFAVIAY